MISYGIDIGTTTLRAVAVRIQIGHFGERSYEPLGKSLCTFTPYRENRELDETKILAVLEEWSSPLSPPEIGTLLFTGEAQRAKNSVACGTRLTELWKGLLSAQLNPEWESRIAAFGSGAVALSESALGKSVVHLDIGGGTANFARIENGNIVDTACLNIGCRKWIVDAASGKVLHTTPEGKYLEKIAPGSFPNSVCEKMSELLLQFAEGRAESEIDPLVVSPWKKSIRQPVSLVSLSGGIVECEEITEPYRYGDVGPLFRKSFVEAVAKRGWKIHFSKQEGKATALGVSTYGFQVAGGSIHVDAGLSQNERNIPLFSEEQGNGLKEFPPCFAIELDSKDTQASAVEALAQKWNAFFQERGLRSETRVLFLLPVNVGKSFGHYFAKAATRPKIWVLDNIVPEESRAGVRTADLIYNAGVDRYLVVLKTLLLF